MVSFFVDWEEVDEDWLAVGRRGGGRGKGRIEVRRGRSFEWDLVDGPSPSRREEWVKDGKDSANRGLALDDRMSLKVPVPVEFVLSGQLWANIRSRVLPCIRSASKGKVLLL